MGTNYYFETDEDQFGVAKKIHLGKHSLGWEFLLRQSELGCSFKQIHRSLGLIDGTVVDEYGDWVGVTKFIELVLDSYNHKEANHRHEEADFFDEDGFAFNCTRFS